MKRFVPVVLFLALAACARNTPVPVSGESTSIAPGEQLAIAVEYVAVPSLTVRVRPAVDAEVTGSYGFKEAISVLERRGEWTRIRTFDGDGWVKQADLMNAAQADDAATSVPRFYIAPAAIPFSTAGEIWLQAKVNTDGDVVEATVTKNTTGVAALANANADALKAAKFYPLVDKGSRKTFVYEHRVYY